MEPNPTIIQKTVSSKERTFMVDSSSWISIFTSTRLPVSFLHKLFVSPLGIRHRTRIRYASSTNLFTSVLRTSLKAPMNRQVLQLFKSIFFLLITTFRRTIPTVLSTDSRGQPFRFLTQVSLSTRSPTIPRISATVQ
jgi:hypothetical protein